MTRCFVALGGNLGPVEDTFGRALQVLDARDDVSVVGQSGVYRFESVGDCAGPPFINAAAEIATSLAPLDLLDVLQMLEERFGRTREVHWGPRHLDLDLIFFGEQIVDQPRLQVPHPACWYRRFVLDPLCDIASNVIHPVKGASVEALRARLLHRPLRVLLAGGVQSDRTILIRVLDRQFPDVALGTWKTAAGDRSQEPALSVWLGPAGSADRGQAGFFSLPLISRLDASGIPAERREEFLRDVLRSALGE